jgi:S-adenosylmethionine synthetase
VSHRDDRYVFTSESVTDGHPDKIADQISDAILDAVMADDPNGRVACETLVTTGMAMIAGEISTEIYVDFPALVRQTIRDIGYTRAKFGFDSETCAVISSIDPQSPDIAMGVDTGGAGDQGIMFGFACDETEELMPMPLMLSHRLARRLRDVRRSGQLDWLRPDGKTQVSIEYESGRPVRVATVVVSTQHSEDITIEDVRSRIADEIIRPVVPAELMDSETASCIINPTGRFVIGGPTGRLWFDRPQDHRRHLRRGRLPRRRRVFRQGPVQGGSLGVVPSATGREEHRRCQTGATDARCSWPTPSAWWIPCR